MDIEITSAELRTLPESEYALIDIRSRTAYDYGHIGGSVNIPENELENAEIPQDKRIVLCCRSGRILRRAQGRRSRTGSRFRRTIITRSG